MVEVCVVVVRVVVRVVGSADRVPVVVVVESLAVVLDEPRVVVEEPGEEYVEWVEDVVVG
ncbi:hypothetical protein UO65_6077 [Actinokineospora spheciospongiae]|uniref:Uncharacterized protein n=1 Tax=Actinokineospora spheciospongiae TaxID=909613 RepID=W7IXA0_9PSEU|nr:hypothetical protein UO65_6077 [Actinokineospora spheciospongiae]